MDQALEYGRAVNFGTLLTEGYLQGEFEFTSGVNPNNRD